MSGHLVAAPKRVRLRLLWIGVGLLLLAALLPSQASAQGNACENATNNTYAKLLDCVTLEGVREHQAAFQAIADANDDPVLPGHSRRRYGGLCRQRRVRRGLAEGRRL